MAYPVKYYKTLYEISKCKYNDLKQIGGIDGSMRYFENKMHNFPNITSSNKPLYYVNLIVEV